jgi:hypothetical protein
VFRGASRLYLEEDKSERCKIPKKELARHTHTYIMAIMAIERTRCGR